MGEVNPINKSLCLEHVCEANYQNLFRLIPELLEFNDYAIGYAKNKPTLHLEIIDRSPHTLTIKLSHCFNQNLDEFLEPAVKIRIYLDAALAEVISDHVRTDVSRVYKDPGQSVEIMNYKWRLNYFLQKWLNHCLNKNYLFTRQHQSGKILA